MSKKPIITIDIDDSKFKAFAEKFDKYQADIEKMPESWKGANEVMNAGVAALVEQTHNISKNLHTAITAQKQFAQATKAGDHGLKSMAKSARSVAHEIFGLGKFLLKAGAWGGGLFAGSLFGIDRLAKSAVESQKSARSLGITTGQQRAFVQDYGRYGLTLGNVNSVANEQNTPGGPAMLSLQTGLPQAVTQRMNPAELSVKVAMGARRLAQRYRGNPQLLSAMLNAYHYGDSGIGLSEARLLMHTSSANLAAAHSNFSRDSLTDNVNKQAVNRLFTFSRELQQAGLSIETNLTRRLSALGPSLSRLIGSLAGDANKLINGLFTAKNIDAIRNGIADLTKYLSSGKMEAGIASFANGLSRLSADMEHLANILHDINPFAWKWPKKIGVALGGDLYKATHEPTQKAFGVPAYKDSVAAKAWDWLTGKTAPPHAAPDGLPAGIIRTQAMIESGGNSLAYNKKSGAMGLMQFMPNIAKSMGLNPWDPYASMIAARKLDQQNLGIVRKRYPNSSPEEHTRMVLAAYNWGIGNVEKDISRHGTAWESYAPKETRDYIGKAMMMMAKASTKPVKVYVTVYNKAGANTAVSANAASR